MYACIAIRNILLYAICPTFYPYNITEQLKSDLWSDHNYADLINIENLVVRSNLSLPSFCFSFSHY